MSKWMIEVRRMNATQYVETVNPEKVTTFASMALHFTTRGAALEARRELCPGKVPVHVVVVPVPPAALKEPANQNMIRLACWRELRHDVWAIWICGQLFAHGSAPDRKTAVFRITARIRALREYTRAQMDHGGLL